MCARVRVPARACPRAPQNRRILVAGARRRRYKYVAEKKLRWERELMKHVPGWDAGREVYLTQKAPQPRKLHWLRSAEW